MSSIHLFYSFFDPHEIIQTNDFVFYPAINLNPFTVQSALHSPLDIFFEHLFNVVLTFFCISYDSLCFNLFFFIYLPSRRFKKKMTFSPLQNSTMASLTTDTSLTQQATALAKEFGLQLMTPASVTVEELEQLLIDQLKKVKALRESNQSTGETNEEAVVNSCPEGALPVEAGLNSFSDAVKKAKEQDIKCLFLKSGLHDEGGEIDASGHCGRVTIDYALKVVGENRNDVKIRASLFIGGKQ